MKHILFILSATFGLILISQIPSRAPAEDLKSANLQKGKQVYDYWCATCHAPSTVNSKYPGTEALTTKYEGKLPGPLAERTDLSPEIVSYFVRNGVSVMPQFRKVEVSDEDLDAISTYLTRNNKP